MATIEIPDTSVTQKWAFGVLAGVLLLAGYFKYSSDEEINKNLTETELKKLKKQQQREWFTFMILGLGSFALTWWVLRNPDEVEFLRKLGIDEYQINNRYVVGLMPGKKVVHLPEYPELVYSQPIGPDFVGVMAPAGWGSPGAEAKYKERKAWGTPDPQGKWEASYMNVQGKLKRPQSF